jgi:hypothetical protein
MLAIRSAAPPTRMRWYHPLFGKYVIPISGEGGTRPRRHQSDKMVVVNAHCMLTTMTGSATWLWHYRLC